MSRLGTRGLEIALFVALATATASAQEPSDGTPPRPIGADHGSVLNLFNRPPAPKKPAPPKVASNTPKPAADKPPPPPPKPVNLADEAAAERDREQQDLLRRQMVCLKLMQIATETRDDELLRKAEQLDERARAIYAQRTSHLPSCKNALFESDEQILEKHLGPANAAAGRSPERSTPRPAARPTSQAQAPEDRP